jgi:DNA-directed RNA polymerase specialized sigma54-like protein
VNLLDKETIHAAIDEGYVMGIDTRGSVKTQLLYVLSNLEGAPESELRKINSIANECDIDVSESIREILEGENGNGAGVRTEERDYAFPDEMIQPAITGYDVASGQPTVSNAAINQLLAQFNLVIVA